jgi:FMN phosphatase YigB (HAD superfamily)
MPTFDTRETQRLNYDAIIFDHDNTLAPAIGVGADLYASAFEAIRCEVPAHLRNDAKYAAVLEQAFAACWYTAFDAVAELYDFTPDVTGAGRRAFAKLTVPPTSHYAYYRDAPLVKELKKHLPCFLVTSGFSRLQNSKIDHLKMRDWFDDFIIESVDGELSTGKEGIFLAIAEKYRSDRLDRMLVVGDNPISEIRAGNSIGMHTVQVLRPGVAADDEARYRIDELGALWPIINLPTQPSQSV